MIPVETGMYRSLPKVQTTAFGKSLAVLWTVVSTAHTTTMKKVNSKLQAFSVSKQINVLSCNSSPIRRNSDTLYPFVRWLFEFGAADTILTVQGPGKCSTECWWQRTIKWVNLLLVWPEPRTWNKDVNITRFTKHLFFDKICLTPVPS